MSTTLKPILIFSLLAVICAGVSADEITLKTGTKLTCVVIAQDNKAIMAETSFGTVTLKKDSIESIKSDSVDTNYVLRGEFFEKKAKYDEAMQYYGEAMIANPKSTIAKEKYNSLHKRMEASNKAELYNYAKSESEEPQITDENVTAGEAKKKLNANTDMILQSEGEAIFPPLPPKGQSKDKIALQNAKLDALRKIFPKGFGVGFKVSRDKVTVLPEGEFPNCKVNVIDKQKTSLGYHVTVQIKGPTESLMVNLPDDYPTLDTSGVTEDIKSTTKEEVQRRALENAIENGIKEALKQKYKDNPKLKQKDYFGRVFPVGILNQALTPNGFVIEVRLKVWFDPASEG